MQLKEHAYHEFGMRVQFIFRIGECKPIECANQIHSHQHAKKHFGTSLRVTTHNIAVLRLQREPFAEVFGHVLRAL